LNVVIADAWRPDRTVKIVLVWSSLTTLIFWLPAIRGPFDGPSYEWGLMGLGGRGVRGDYWVPALGAIAATAVIAGAWRGYRSAMTMLAVWHIALAASVTAFVMSSDEGIRLRGDTLGLDVSLTWMGPILF
jgi:hypothetical protein